MVATPCRHGPNWDDQTSVAVLILNWNGRRFLGPCLKSVMSEACRHVEVVLVDNASTDDSIEMVQREFSSVKVVALQENFGYSHSYNVAVNRVSSRFVVFLNNDTVVETGWLVPLIDELIQDRRVAITTSKVLFLGTHVINAAGGKLKLWQGGSELGFGCDEGFLDDRNPVEPFYASGSSMAMSRQGFLELGGFDSKLTLYAEDLDLSWRARLAGFTIRFTPKSVVQHHYSGTSGVFDPVKHRLGTTHYLAVMIKCLSTRHLIHGLPASTVFALAKGGVLAISERNLAYLANVVASLRETVRMRRELLERRRETQRRRVVPDRQVLRSEGFGLFESPWALLRVFRQGRRLKRRVQRDQAPQPR